MPRIDQMFAFVAEEAPGEEGVTGFQGPDGKWYPMVGADQTRIDQLKPIARQLARHSGTKIRLLKFSVREEMEVIEP